MTTLNATRQAAYRRRHLDDGQTARLDLLVDAETKRTLQRMAAQQGVTLREVLQRLVAGAASGTVARRVQPQAEADGLNGTRVTPLREPDPPTETPIQRFAQARTAALQTLARRTPPAHECVERQEILQARVTLSAKGIRW